MNNHYSQPQPQQENKPLLDTNGENKAESKAALSKQAYIIPKFLVWLLIGLIVTLTILLGVSILRNQRQKTPSSPLPSSSPTAIIPNPSTHPANSPIATFSPTNSPLPSLSPETNTQASSPSPQVTPASNYPPNWKQHVFDQVNVKLATPPQWQSSYQYFPNTSSNLIKFWLGSTPDTTTIQLNIKPNWDNTGNAKYLPQEFKINNQLMAAKVDPPKKDEKKLDRYQTNYYFETGKKVYIFTCVHNWLEEQYQLCETMLQTGRFN